MTHFFRAGRNNTAQRASNTTESTAIPAAASRVKRRNIMRSFSILRALALAAALTVPLAQAASADQQVQQEQQAMAGRSAATAPSYGAGPYSDQLTAPSVGD